MITRITVRCEIPGCPDELTFEPKPGVAHAAGWKFENGSQFGIHLCPKHSRLSIDQAKEMAWAATITPAPTGVKPPGDGR